MDKLSLFVLWLSRVGATRHIVYKLFFMVSIQLLLGLQQVFATTYYVSPSGSDSNNGTSLSTTFKTIKNGLSKAQASGDIVYVMTGTYAESLYIGQSNITLSAYPGNSPVIDGSTLPGVDWAKLIYVVGNYNTVSGFEVKNCNINTGHVGGNAVQVDGTHNLISKMNVHHSWDKGIRIVGDYNTVEDSVIWQNARSNSVSPGSGVWGSGITAARNSTSAAIKPGITSYPTLRRNIVYNNWGEGLSCWEADHCTLQDNIVYDNWTNNFYLSDASNSLVQRNIVYVSSQPAIVFRDNLKPGGITLADEVSTVPRSMNNTIINNFIYNTNLLAFRWTVVTNSGLNNVLIANNTIVDGGLQTGYGGSSSIVNTNSQIRNNIILGTTSYVPSNVGITFSNNNWSSAPSQAVSSSDVSGDPQIARTGTTTPGTLTSAYFKILNGSPVINKAMSLSSVSADFFLNTRGSSPDIGGHEYVAAAALVAPTNLRLVSVSATQAQIQWDYSGSSQTGFVVNRKSSSTYAQVGTVAASTQAYADSAVQSSTQYCYEVQAYNSTQSSANSNELCLTTSASATTPTASTNIALNRPVTASSTQAADAHGSYYPSYAVDGKGSTRWSSAFSDPQWISIDLGSSKLINRVVLNWEAAYAKSYSIQVSNDNVTWTNIYSTTSGTGGTNDLSISGIGRYIRMYGTVRGTQYGYSLYEMSVYGTDATPVLLSLNKPVSVSSTQATDTHGSYYASYALDGNTGTRWASIVSSNPQWITVDLGAIKQISHVVLNWEVAYGKSYSIQVSNDNATWTTIYSTTAGDGGIDDLTGLSGSGRYIRMYGTVRGTQYGYSLYEMSVYGN